MNGVAGTTDFENGTVNNPTNLIASAKTIADSVGLRIIHVVSGSAVTLAADFSSYEFRGTDYTMALGGQAVDGTLIQGSSAITGTFTGTPRIVLSSIGNITGPSIDAHQCGFTGTVTCDAAGDWFIHHCFSKVAGTSAPIFDFGAAVDNTNLNFRDYSGGIDLRNMGQAGTDNASIEGRGQVIFNANCTGGTAVIRGLFDITDNGSATVTKTAAFNAATQITTIATAAAAIQTDTEDIQGRLPAALAAGLMKTDILAINGDTSVPAILEALMQGGLLIQVNDGGATTTAFAADQFTEATDNHFKGRLITFITGDLRYQQTDITGYDAADGPQGAQEFTVTALTEAPANDVWAVIH